MIDAMTPAASSDQKLMERDAPEPGEARSALVQRWQSDIKTARQHWKPDFDRMHRNTRFAAGWQWRNQRPDDDRYRVNLVQRVLKVVVSSLYAKNPTIIHKRRPKIDFTIWDGKAETLMQAQQTVAQAQAALGDGTAVALAAQNPQGYAAAQAAVMTAQQLLQDVQNGMAQRQLVDKIGKTLVAVASYYISEDQPGFKQQMKKMVRRARTTGVGYVKLGFQREMDLTEAQIGKVNEQTELLATIGRLTADLADGEHDPYSAEAEELRLSIAAIQSNPEKIIREGATFDFPHSTRIIPSTSTRDLMGWVGCEWLAEEIPMTTDRIKEVYGVDVGKSYTAYRTVPGSPDGGETRRIADRSRADAMAMVYHVWDKRTGMELVLCEGYSDFLKEPGEPAVFIERFFPIFAVTFNDCEEEGRLFPDSDVENLTSIQREVNRVNEAKRQHRIANRPLYLSPKGTFEEDEVTQLTNYEAHTVIEVNALEKGRPVSDVIAPVPKIGVDPNLYETGSLFEDMQRVTGNTEANLGSIGGGTATESSIAEGSRQGTLDLDKDDLDEMLTDLFRALGQVLLSTLSADKARQIAGQGAVWPELTRQQIMDELYLEVKAGSTGRPNAAADAAKFERIYPLLVQVPGISPRWLAERAVMLADDDVDLAEAIADGMPSIMAMNKAAQPSTGDPATDPEEQGEQGAQNDPKSKANGDNGQPGYTPAKQ